MKHLWLLICMFVFAFSLNANASPMPLHKQRMIKYINKGYYEKAAQELPLVENWAFDKNNKNAILDIDTTLSFISYVDSQNVAPATTKVANGLQFTVTGLNSSTNYAYSVTVKDNSNQTINSYEGSFKTTGVATSLENQQSQIKNQKLIKDGQLFILRGDKTYTITGAEVK